MSEYTIPTQAIITYGNSDWRLQPVLARSPGPKELLVRVIATGICHTDIVNKGNIAPRILGHEGAGRVLQKGSACTVDVEIGDPVLLSFAHCRKCYMCTSGHPAHCDESGSLTLRAEDLNYVLAEGEEESLEKDHEGKRRIVKAGYFGHSSFSGIAVVKESSIVSVKGLVNNDEELEIFAPLGCGIQTGACAVTNVVRPAPCSSIAVIGLGGVGLSAVMASRALDLPVIIAVDIVKSRLELARDLGATHTIDTSNIPAHNLASAIRGLPPFHPNSGGPLGPAAIIDTTGIPSVIRAALSAVSRLGRVVQLANQGPGSSVELLLQEHMSAGVSLTGTIQGDADPAKSLPMLIQWYRDGKLPLEKFQKRFRVEDFDQAVKEMHEGGVVKPILIWP